MPANRIATFAPPWPDPPATVKIGPLTYTISRFDPREANERALYGFVRNADQAIWIDLQHGPERGALALLHELLHAVADVHPIELGDKDKEESIVQALTTVLGASLRDSPEVWLWILERLGLDLERRAQERRTPA